MIKKKSEQININPKLTKKHKGILLAAILIGFLGNCISVQINDELYRTYLTREFNYPKDKVIQATLAALKTQKIGVEKVEE
ncbi:hypothetical protein [Leptospira licerasiae]|uniref:hypothetical protein n=1 Tax=Leptospira licerasiae TaxID=447106 RepID=UPI0010826367|nr:hypothetical protein [Leptospira licerasiae]TGM91131.1 hypothetical protein EHR05_10260 [Leptospira licerasiae]